MGHETRVISKGGKPPARVTFSSDLDSEMLDAQTMKTASHTVLSDHQKAVLHTVFLTNHARMHLELSQPAHDACLMTQACLSEMP